MGIPGSTGQCSCLRLIQKKAGRMDLIIDLLYEIKAGTPLGRILVVLFNISLQRETNPVSINLCGIPLPALACLAGVTGEELAWSLDYLELKGIIAK